MMRIADYMIECLAQNDVNHIFTVTGRGTLYLTDAVAKNKVINAVCVHNEQAGAYSAVAYAKCRNSLGACLVTTGCGATNAISGVLCAWQDEVACVFISGQNMLNETTSFTKAKFRTFGSQEADIVSLVKPITKYSIMLSDTAEAAYEIEKAIYLSKKGKQGPVWIDIPLDIQNARIEVENVRHFVPKEDVTCIPDKADIDLLESMIAEAKRPVILIGNGIRVSKAVKCLEYFIAATSMPVVYAHTAVDVYGKNHEMSIGCVGSLCGTRAGNFTVQNSDLLIIIGCRMTSMTTGNQPEKFAREAKTVVVDVDRNEHTKGTYHVDYFIQADARLLLEELTNRSLKRTSEEWILKCQHWKHIFAKCENGCRHSGKVDLYYLAEVLSIKMADDSFFVCDAGLEELILPANMEFGRGIRCIQPAMQGAMGFALPAAIAAACSGDNQVVAVIGDGSVMMNLQELQTIHYNKLPIKIIVTNNNAYAVIRQRQRDLFRSRTIGTDSGNGLECADFEKIAEAFGMSYLRISDSAELVSGLERLMKMEGVVLCEIRCVEEQDYLRTAYAKTESGRFVQRPLEDQAPFLDREIFLKEMVIDPIDQ